MEIGIIIYGGFALAIIVILISYSIYTILDESKKVAYYNRTIFTVTDWDKYNKMVKRQKKIIFKKKLQLAVLNCLNKLKG